MAHLSADLRRNPSVPPKSVFDVAALRLTYHIATNLPRLQKVIFVNIPTSTVSYSSGWRQFIVLPVRTPELKVFQGVMVRDQNTGILTTVTHGEGWIPESLDRA